MTYKLLSMFSDYRDMLRSIAEKRDLSQEEWEQVRALHREQGKTRITSSSENKT